MGSDCDGDDGGDERVLKTLLGAVALGVFVCLLFIGILASREIEGSSAATRMLPGNLRHVVLGRERHSVPVKPDPITVSKRRVPSGPDPIHNRHVGATRRPTGRA